MIFLPQESSKRLRLRPQVLFFLRTTHDFLRVLNTTVAFGESLYTLREVDTILLFTIQKRRHWGPEEL
eukprot:scaffold120663_cov36-Tisochrysis_lutea.AAC.1